MNTIETLTRMDWPAAFAFIGFCASIGIPVATHAARRYALQIARIEADRDARIAEINVTVKNGAVPALRDGSGS